MRTRSLAIPALAATLALLASGVPAGATTLPGADNVSGCTKKDQRAIVAAVAATPGQKIASIDSGQCVDGWAVVFPVTAGVNAAGDGSIEYTQILRRGDNGRWGLVPRTPAVCGKGPVKGDIYKRPKSASIAPEIYISGCLTN